MLMFLTWLTNVASLPPLLFPAASGGINFAYSAVLGISAVAIALLYRDAQSRFRFDRAKAGSVAELDAAADREAEGSSGSDSGSGSGLDAPLLGGTGTPVLAGALSDTGLQLPGGQASLQQVP